MVFRTFDVNGRDMALVYSNINSTYGSPKTSLDLGENRNMDFYDIKNAMLVMEAKQLTYADRLRIGGEQGAVEGIVEALDLKNLAEEVRG